MSLKLSYVNPHLRDPGARKRMIIRSVVTSSAIDGIRVVFKRRHKSADEIRVRGIRSKVPIDAAPVRFVLFDCSWSICR